MFISLVFAYGDKPAEIVSFRSVISDDTCLCPTSALPEFKEDIEELIELIVSDKSIISSIS